MTLWEQIYRQVFKCAPSEGFKEAMTEIQDERKHFKLTCLFALKHYNLERFYKASRN